MSSTKKHTHSPEVSGPLSTGQDASVQIHQNAPPKRRWQGPKDDHLKALRKLEHKGHSTVFRDTNYQLIITGAPQLNARVHCMAPAPAKSPLQRSPGLTVPHSPPSPPAEGEEGGLENFNDSPVVPHLPLSPGLHTVSSVQDNCTLFHQTYHLDNHPSAWNQCRDNQATEWTSVTIPRLMLIYLANCTAMKSGRLPPPCDVCSPKASLSQGRKGKWEWKGTPELTDANLLTGRSGGKRDERGQ
jgi:hypothetical protein